MPKVIEQAPWMTEGEDKRREVQKMFSDIAPSYDLVNSLLCFRMHYRWRQRAVTMLNLQPGESALDLCCGTGDFLPPLRKAVGESGTVVGLDFCEPMLTIAQTKMGDVAELSLADACQLPITSGRFDAVTVGWGLRNVPKIEDALREAERVLRPGGRFISLDMARPRGKVVGRVSEWVFHVVAPAMGRLFGKTRAYQYLPKSTLKFKSREELVQMMQDAGFENVRYRDLFFGNICMHWGTKP